MTADLDAFFDTASGFAEAVTIAGTSRNVIVSENSLDGPGGTEAMYEFRGRRSELDAVAHHALIVWNSTNYRVKARIPHRDGLTLSLLARPE